MQYLYTKICNKCKIPQENNYFSNNKNSPDGKEPRCKLCTKQYKNSIKEQQKLYLEQQFINKMDWNNYGKIWEIDHIKPCSKFDLTKLEEQQKCFHYINLMPRFKTTEIAEQYGSNQIGNRNKSNQLK